MRGKAARTKTTQKSFIGSRRSHRLAMAHRMTEGCETLEKLADLSPSQRQSICPKPFSRYLRQERE
jgi:hypothetical protein